MLVFGALLRSLLPPRWLPVLLFRSPLLLPVLRPVVSARVRAARAAHAVFYLVAAPALLLVPSLPRLVVLRLRAPVLVQSRLPRLLLVLLLAVGSLLAALAPLSSLALLLAAPPAPAALAPLASLASLSPLAPLPLAPLVAPLVAPLLRLLVVVYVV